MDFTTNRSASSQPVAPSTAAAPRRGRQDDQQSKWARIGAILGVGSVVILLVAMILFTAFGGPKSEDKYVDNSRLQAVFLNTGQVYFGNVKNLNTKYLVLRNIYYLQTASNGNASSTANANITLVKLGCELHEPLDQMVINRDQVTFWENLSENGQVAKAVAKFKQDNPKGQKCADQSSSAGSNSASSTQNAGNSTPATSTNSTKP